MVSKSNVIETETKCICGNGDTENKLKNYFQNKCPVCGVEGKLQAETENNSEVSDEFTGVQNSSNTSSDEINDDSPNVKVVCKNCGAEFCGQDGYDKNGGLRSGLTTVNPNEVTEDEDEETSTTEEGETTYMSGWEGLCDLLKPLDGEAMMVQRGDFVVVKKIEMPQTAKLWAYEGINVVDDSVSITDYTPEIYNTFVIKWGESFENELEFVFNKHKNLFGERKIVIEAKKYTVKSDDESSDSQSSTESSESNGGVSDTIANSSVSEEDLKNMDKLGIDSKNINTSDINTENINANDLSANGESGTGSENSSSEVEEIPITTKEEAIRFGLTQVGKAKREDGHTVELKVIGNNHWQMGEWCHVRLPSFNEDSYMFISKCGFESSADSEYIHSLTLVDYPPSLGKPDKKNQENQNQEENSNTDENSGDSNTSDESNSESTDNSNSDSTTNSDNANGG